MSADVLRRAAASIRRYVRDEDDWAHLENFHLAVADLLDDEARKWDDSQYDPRVRNEHAAFALAAARAYFGDPS